MKGGMELTKENMKKFPEGIMSLINLLISFLLLNNFNLDFL